MKYKHVIEPALDSTRILIESLVKGLDNNTISKPEMKNKLEQVLNNLERIANTISIEQNSL